MKNSNAMMYYAEAPLPSKTVIPKSELREFSAYFKGKIFGLIHKQIGALRQQGWTQKDLSTRLSMDEGQLSRLLSGERTLRLETLSDLARGLDCVLDVAITPFPNVPKKVVYVTLRDIDAEIESASGAGSVMFSPLSLAFDKPVGFTQGDVKYTEPSGKRMVSGGAGVVINYGEPS